MLFVIRKSIDWSRVDASQLREAFGESLQELTFAGGVARGFEAGFELDADGFFGWLFKRRCPEQHGFVVDRQELKHCPVGVVRAVREPKLRLRRGNKHRRIDVVPVCGDFDGCFWDGFASGVEIEFVGGPRGCAGGAEDRDCDECCCGERDF